MTDLKQKLESMIETQRSIPMSVMTSNMAKERNETVRLLESCLVMLEALEFYQTEASYIATDDHGLGEESVMTKDAGDLARTTIAKVTERMR